LEDFKARRKAYLQQLQRTDELDQPLTNRGFLIGCSLIAEAIDWATTRDEFQVEGLTTAFQRARKVFVEFETHSNVK
jgi:hypothetical protein